MKRIKQRELNINAECTYSEEECFELLYNGVNLSEVIFALPKDFKNNYEDLYFKPFNERQENLESTFHQEKSNTWLIPEEFKIIVVKEFVLKLCKSELEIQRVEEEYKLFEERNLIQMLQFIIYFVSYLRRNNLTWGVGRGSSVNSYILFLLGLHKINSIKYQLDIKEFLR